MAPPPLQCSFITSLERGKQFCDLIDISRFSLEEKCFRWKVCWVKNFWAKIMAMIQNSKFQVIRICHFVGDREQTNTHIHWHTSALIERLYKIKQFSNTFRKLSSRNPLRNSLTNPLSIFVHFCTFMFNNWFVCTLIFLANFCNILQIFSCIVQKINN